MSGKRGKNLTLEQRIELARRYQSGEAAKDLAVAFGVSPRHVARVGKEERGDALDVRDPSQVVTFRAALSEIEAFDAAWTAFGFASRGQALKALLRARCGVLDVTADRMNVFLDAWKDARTLTDAARTLAKGVRRGQRVLLEADRKLVQDLFTLAEGLTREMGAMKAFAQNQRALGLDSGPLKREQAPSLVPDRKVQNTSSDGLVADRRRKQARPDFVANNRIEAGG